MTEINISDPDWLIIRQALSLSLLRQVPITIGGAAGFLEAHADYRPLLDDLARFADTMGAGAIALDGDAVRYDPLPFPPRRAHFETGPHSSAVEPLLFALPTLFHADFRTVLEFSGVTHSPLSAPTSFVKETLLGALERLGLYGSLTLRRFGFYGSGGGAMEARAYPREEAGGGAFAGSGATLSGAKIFISHLDTGLAELEKNMIADLTGIDRGRIAIIEVLESDGPGNGIQVFADCDGLPVVISRELRLFSRTGEIMLSEETLRDEIAALAGEAGALRAGALPERLARELAPYYMLSGKNLGGAPDTPGTAMTRALCARLL